MSEEIDTSWIKPGVPVWYYPDIGDEERYLGMIAGEVRMLGGTPVVRLSRMESAYRHSGVTAASIFAIRPAYQEVSGG